MISTSKAKEIAREIASIEIGSEYPAVVSLDANGEAKWGEVMALPEDEMIAALESAGLNPDISEMMTADDFREYYADCLN